MVNITLTGDENSIERARIAAFSVMSEISIFASRKTQWPFSLDTNVLVYAEARFGAKTWKHLIELLKRLR